MTKRKAKRPPPRRRDPAPDAAPAVDGGLALARVLDRSAGTAVALAAIATLPVIWRAAAGSLPRAVAVSAIALLAIGCVLLDRRQWSVQQQRQMLLTIAFVALSGGLWFGSPLGALPIAAVAAVLAFKRGFGTASALALGAGVAISLMRLDPVIGYFLIIGAAWPAIGATLMRRIVSVQSGRDLYA